MSTIRSRVALGGVALALLASACATGDDGDVPSTSVSNDVDAPATLPADASASTDVADESASAESETESDRRPSLPANIWPEDFVEPEEVEVFGGEVASDGDAKGVVTRSADAEGDGVLPAGVSSVTARVTSADGEECEVCLWLADDDEARRRGLMDVTDLGDAVGMAFVWDAPRTGNFFMFQTPTPLSIAWFDEGGEHVGQADMEPCLADDSVVCERYTADSPYVLAVEMFGGQLEAIGIGPESSIELLDLPCA